MYMFVYYDIVYIFFLIIGYYQEAMPIFGCSQKVKNNNLGITTLFITSVIVALCQVRVLTKMCNEVIFLNFCRHEK